MELIKATDKHLDELTEMNIRLRNDEKMDNVMTDDAVRKRMRDFLANPDYKVFICSKNQNTIGYVLLNTNSTPVYLRQLFVKPEYRRKGFGKEIINKALFELKIKIIDLDVMVWNDSAIKFYEKIGFQKRYIGMRYGQ